MTSKEERISVGQRLLRGAVEAVEGFEYLFLVPYTQGCIRTAGDPEWQVATRDGHVVTTRHPEKHFGGGMPKIVAGSHFLKTIPYDNLEDAQPSWEGMKSAFDA